MLETTPEPLTVAANHRTHPRGAADHRRFAVMVVLVLYFVVLLRTAWLSDDAYITLRTVDNFVHGFGLRWNVDERVQAYTHPLWMLLLSLFYAVTRAPYFTTVAFSIGWSLLALFWLGTRVAINTLAAMLAMALLLFSRAFVDFSTSGLENPLTNVLIVFFLWYYFESTKTRRRFFALSLLSGLATLNRMDTLLLLLPALLFETWQYRRERWVSALLVGFAPFLVWELFSILYYGFPFPNTAYAKLHTGIPAHVIIRQGFIYFIDSLERDPLTLIAVLGAVLLSTSRQHRRMLPISLGILLYCAYVVRVGGDFMSGRFLVAPLVCAACLFAQLDYSFLGDRWWVSFVPIVIFGVLAPKDPSWRTGRTFGPASYPDYQGIGDERYAYYGGTGLLFLDRDRPMPVIGLVQEGEKERARGPHVVINGWIGIMGYYAGPQVHIVDRLALSDPLLARLPMKAGPWRIGHFEREIPAGYEATLATGRNVIADAATARLFDDLSLVTRGKIFSFKRVRAILRLNLGS